MDKLESIARRLSQLRLATHYGRVQSIRAGLIAAEGLNGRASVGDRVRIALQSGDLGGEIVGLSPRAAQILPEGPIEGLSVGAQCSWTSRRESRPAMPGSAGSSTRWDSPWTAAR